MAFAGVPGLLRRRCSQILLDAANDHGVRVSTGEISGFILCQPKAKSLELPLQCGGFHRRSAISVGTIGRGL